MSAVKKCFGDVKIPDFSIEIPENPDHGDYATNVAFVLAKLLRKNSMEVASTMADALGVRNDGLGIKVVSPGFINFWISHETLWREFGGILKRGNKYGAGKRKKEKIQVEFISANPTGPLTLANGRGGFYGDVLSRTLKHQGFFVEREYYVNDAGNQIRTLGFSILASSGLGISVENHYQGKYISRWAKDNKRKAVSTKDDPERLGREAAKDFLKLFIRPAVEDKMKIHFDRWTSEYKDIRGGGYIVRVRKIFQSKRLEYSKDGAIWLKTKLFGDDKDRVLVTSEGFPTYFLVDAGHYLETKSRGFSKINIVGADHYGYVSRIQSVARILRFKKSEVIVMQLVRLVSGGREVRMSKRKGAFVTIDQLINMVGVDATRYFFLEKSPDTHMDFNLDLAKEQSVKNPVYYIQYAHARMTSIFRKVKIRNKNQGINNCVLLKETDELLLIKKLIQFPELLEDITGDYQIQRLTRYTLELAGLFHNFYEKHRVISKDVKITRARLSLVQAAKIVLKSSLNLMGISAPAKM